MELQENIEHISFSEKSWFIKILAIIQLCAFALQFLPLDPNFEGILMWFGGGSVYGISTGISILSLIILFTKNKSYYKIARIVLVAFLVLQELFLFTVFFLVNQWQW